MILKHIKSGVLYTVESSVKVKLNGKWVDMILYKNPINETFARVESDFDGFVEVNK
tara:strand:+ start:4920 stop:5087 length:168 start_codon:yes stop_codon:yes gene_type:complete